MRLAVLDELLREVGRAPERAGALGPSETPMLRYAAAEVLRYSRHLKLLATSRLARLPLAETRFVVFGQGRSGSTLLVSLLDSHREIRCDGEILSKRVWFPYSHVKACCASARAPVYGCKILSYQLRMVQPGRDLGRFVKRLADDGFRIIYLRRENALSHAVSNIRARKFGFHSRDLPKSSARPSAISIGLDELIQWAERAELNWDHESSLLEGVPHLALTYERDLEDAGQQQRTASRAFEFLGLQPQAATSPLKRVSPSRLSDSISNYSEIAESLLGTRWEKYLSQAEARETAR